MFLPLPLLLGLLVVAANTELLPSLPGSGTWARLLPTLALLALPTVLALAALRSARVALLGGRERVPARALLRLSALATPLCVHAVYAFGDYGDVVDQLAQDSHLARMLLSVLPVFLAELPRIGWSTLAETTDELRDGLGDAGAVDAALLPRRADVAAFVRMRLGGPALVAMPLLLLGIALDLLQLHRSLYVCALVTTPGVVLSTIGFLLLVVALLPAWFKIAFGVRALPEPLASRLRVVAAALGFRPDRLHLLPTGMRALNAMLVGPLPFGRRLCLTDGLVRELDGDSLAGVVAHEIGHAKYGHPAILLTLVVVVPLLLLAPLRFVDFEHMDVVMRAALLVAGAIAAWIVVRALAHRFEHEADVASVQALGAGPCTRALQVVAKLAVPHRQGLLGRLLSMHPEEPRRWQVMQRYENDPAFRAAFEARSAALRRGVAVVFVLALVAGSVACALDWRYERVLWRLHAGDHRDALALARTVDGVPERWQQPWQALQEELAVARELAPEATDWNGAQAALRASAWTRGEDVLLAHGPAAARPWFALWLGASESASDLQRALHAFCQAAADHEPERKAELAAIVRRLGVPPKLAKVFAE